MQEGQGGGNQTKLNELSFKLVQEGQFPLVSREIYQHSVEAKAVMGAKKTKFCYEHSNTNFLVEELVIAETIFLCLKNTTAWE